MMKTVEIRELKKHLSTYLRLVRNGEPIAVADRGQPIAELWPPSEAAKYPLLYDLARKGTVRLGGPNDPALYPAMELALKWDEIAQLLDEERGDH
jgi:prevent-host-death family protein